MENNNQFFWDRDDVQFPRLLAEIKAAGLSSEILEAIRVSMDCTVDDINEILDRAEETFEAIKEQMDTVEDTCVICGCRHKRNT